MIEGEFTIRMNEQELNYEIKVGSTVMVKDPCPRGAFAGILPGMIGKVRVISTKKPKAKYGVEFESQIYGHSCDGVIDNNQGFYMAADELLLLVSLSEYHIEEHNPEPCTDEELLDFLGIT